MAKVAHPDTDRSAGAGACDQVKIVQSDIVLYMMFLQKKMQKEITLLNVKVCPQGQSERGLWFKSDVCWITSCCILSLFLGRSCSCGSLILSLS